MTTKADLVKCVWQRVGLAKSDSAHMVDAVLETIRQTLEQGEDVKLSGFGNFHVRAKSERIGRNPKTGETVMISARKVVTFHPSAKMKAKINHA
ncbi:MAG: integration host factor subunit alpha [Mariprofundales bacterium]